MTMACLHRETAVSYLRGDLEPAEADRCAVHVAACEACRRLVQEVSALFDDVRQDLQTLDDPDDDSVPPLEAVRRRVLALEEPAPVEAESGPDADGPSGKASSSGPAALLLPRLLSRPFWRRPAALLAATAVVALVFWLSADLLTPRVSAAELLRASSQAEAARLAKPGLVAHRAFTLEARRLPEATLVARRRVELWANPKSRIKARRVFDEKDHLLGGEWTNPDGSRVVYEPGKLPRKESASDPKPLTADTVWRWEPSAADFSSLVVNLERVHANATEAGYQLSFDDQSGRVAQAELSLDKDHLPVAQRLVLRDVGGQVLEFRTARSTAEDVPESRVSPASFQPEPELLPPAPAPPPLAPTLRLPALTLDQLELQASYRVHRLADCLAQPAELSRGARTAFDINVVLVSEACRLEAQRDLASLAETPGVSVETSVAEPKASGTSDLGHSLHAGDLSAIPAYPSLYDFYARQALRHPQQGARDVDAAVKPLIRQLVQWTLGRSGRALAYARELQRLSARWKPETLSKLGLDATAMWRAMVRDQARSLRQDTELLLAQLQQALGLPLASDEDEPVPPLRNLSDVRRAVADLASLAEANDTSLRTLLSAPSKTTPAPDPARLARDLQRTVRLAGQFAEPWSLEP